jgi:hypothetical protein
MIPRAEFIVATAMATGAASARASSERGEALCVGADNRWPSQDACMLTTLPQRNSCALGKLPVFTRDPYHGEEAQERIQFR